MLDAGNILAHGDGGGLHLGLLQQDGFDLGEFHAEAAQLHLAVGAAHEFDFAVGHPAREVAGFIEARVRTAGRREGIWNKFFRR